ncbi:MAG: hypothetical protein PHG66_00980 [Candidatus Colwellbacteria bacterium]|nr:hypothetical protein [Candidatus Colwellbacteria bacterium]
MSSTSAYTALGQYLIGKEKSDRENTKLKDAAVCGSIVNFKSLVSRGYNPYRPDNDGKMPFEWAEDQEKFKELSAEWIHQLAFDMNPDTFSDDSDDEDRKKTLEKVVQYVVQVDGHELAMLREHLSSMRNNDEEDEDEKTPRRYVQSTDDPMCDHNYLSNSRGD